MTVSKAFEVESLMLKNGQCVLSCASDPNVDIVESVVPGTICVTDTGKIFRRLVTPGNTQKWWETGIHPPAGQAGTNGWRYLPRGRVLQWGVVLSTNNNTQTYNFNFKFDSVPNFITLDPIYANKGVISSWGAPTTTQFSIRRNNSFSNSDSISVLWIAEGPYEWLDKVSPP